MNEYFKMILLVTMGMILALILFYLCYKIYLFCSINIILNELIENGSTTLKW